MFNSSDERIFHFTTWDSKTSINIIAHVCRPSAMNQNWKRILLTKQNKFNTNNFFTYLICIFYRRHPIAGDQD